MLIYLLGYMGSGKSTVAQPLASMLNYSFIDSDEAISELEGLSVSDIFRQHGEVYFRNLESAFLSNHVETTDTVISTGGGMPCSPVNISMIKNSGISFYLLSSKKELLQRLMHDKENRPLLDGLSDSEIDDFMQQQFLEREKFYFQADCIIDADQPVGIVVKDIFTFIIEILDSRKS